MKTIRELIDSITRHVVVEQGEQNGWKYRKYADGTAEIWYYGYGKSNQSFSAWGSLYYGDMNGPTFPFEFVDYPYVFLTPLNSQAYVIGHWGTTYNKLGTIRFGHNAANSSEAYVNIYAIGRWK